MINKLIMFDDDIQLMSVCQKEKGYIVDSMDYTLQRILHGESMHYGPTQTTVLNMTLRLGHDRSARDFYEKLAAPGNYTFSLVFDAQFNADQHLSDYGSLTLVNGYVVGVEEDFEGGLISTTQADDEQMHLTLRILVSHLVYAGAMNEVRLTLFDN